MTGAIGCMFPAMGYHPGHLTELLRTWGLVGVEAAMCRYTVGSVHVHIRPVTHYLKCEV